MTENPAVQQFRIMGHEASRTIICPYCQETIKRTIVPHMRSCHKEIWLEWCLDFVKLFNEGHSLKQIMKEYGTLFSWTVIAREILRTSEENRIPLAPPIEKVNSWGPPTFRKESTTLWQFPKRGDWFVHNTKYRGNWAPQVPRNIILQYSSKDDLVLDCFLGGATTTIESLLLQRKGIGLDISPHAISMSKKIITKIKEEATATQKNVGKYLPNIILGDARNLPLRDNSIDLVCCQPPYADAISYTWNVIGDLSRIHNVKDFCSEVSKVASELYRVLKTDKRCAVMVGDIRRNKMIIPLGLKVLQAFLNAKFITEEILIKKQFNDGSAPFYRSKNADVLAYRIEHEYIFVLRKRRDEENEQTQQI